MNLWKFLPKSVHSELRNNFLKIFACGQGGKLSWPGRHSPVASADYALVVISKTRDACFTGSLVK